MTASTSPKETSYSSARSGQSKQDIGQKAEDDNEKKGLFHPMALAVVVAWYIVSFFVLVINKHVLTSLKGDAVLLSCIQMVVLTVLAYIQMYYSCGLSPVVQRDGPKPPSFYKNNIIVGSVRFMTVFMGILALRYTTISFTETVKSSAPIFTVIISRIMLGELNGPYVICSLIPIMLGLALCSAYELSFSVQGFVAALANNFFECPAEFQFYTGLASSVVQIPCCLLLIDIPYVWSTMTRELFLLMCLDGVLYHLQTLLAFVLMSYISPVTHSVVNVVKRAFMIWGSVFVFSNPITFLSGVGTCIVFSGVLVYNKAREYEQKTRQQLQQHMTSLDATDSRQEAPIRHV